MSHQEITDRFVTALEAAARAQERGELHLIEQSYTELEGLLSRGADVAYDNLRIALHFLDGWIDSRNHDWMYYDISESDWPRLARSIAEDLRADRNIADERVLREFDWRRQVRGPSLWQCVKAWFTVRGGAV